MHAWADTSPMAGWVTSAVQLGFIVGTLIFALCAISDRFSPRRVFLLCATAGAVANLLTVAAGAFPGWLLLLRFICGFFLAGIYPVGMKIAAGWFEKGLGNALGFLIGALVLGTAFPHLLKGGPGTMPWQVVIMLSSGFCLLGGVVMVALVPDGPHMAKAVRFNPQAVAALLTQRRLRAAALGYFGHMWELYTLWAFVPLFLSAYADKTPDLSLNIPLWCFLIIASGSLGCIAGGMVSNQLGSAAVARICLAISGICCLLSPLFFATSPHLFLSLMLLWGIAVVGDSAQFSTIVAHTAPRELVGSALTLVNCIGFSVTVASLFLLQWLSLWAPPQYLLTVLAVGPALGLYGMNALNGKT